MKVKKIYETDPWLEPFKGAIEKRNRRLQDEIAFIKGGRPSLADGINNHLFYGLHKTPDGWVFRVWAPNATRIFMIG